jgi:bifunctional UDP-N-acetylglucosamine pyrophosphorylase/glucosamine-1-phosphate N-acetyltransferase
VPHARPAAVVVLAAGEGKRMRSATPKMLHQIGGRSLLGHVLAATAPLDAQETVVVVGHGRDQVQPALAELAPQAKPVVQEAPLGTGHAVRRAFEALPDLAGTVVVVPGDTPLLTADTLAALVAQHQRDGVAATLLSSHLTDPTGYGRVVRNADGVVVRLVEHRDADAAELAVTEVGTSIYAFDAALLRAALSRLTTDNAQGEEYLTDTIALFVADGRPVGALVAADPVETIGINDRVQLATAGRLLNDRLLAAHMRAGVTVVDPLSTWVDADVEIGVESVLLPGVQLLGRTRVGAGVRVGPDSTLSDTVVGDGAQVVRTHSDGAEIGPEATVGPFAYLRPGARLGRKAKVGTYVEVKNSEIGEGAKVPHLTYVGDATIGEGSNIGAASVFVNYDGVEKHRTTIGKHTRTGSDNMFVAPVSVGDGAYTAAGSVITEDVPPGALAVARARQRNIDGWVQRMRSGTSSAQAAAAAQAAGEDNGQGTAPQEPPGHDDDPRAERAD